MRFWDASAIVPLLVFEPSSELLLDLLERDPVMVVWWGAPVECTSAIARRERDGALTVADATTALERLRAVAAGWHEVLPVDPVRGTAQRLLRVHPLRSADSLQLAAAIVAAEHEPPTLEFVSLDERLNDAASREGFRTVRV
jgi:predicted nucleic acid-binding protein